MSLNTQPNFHNPEKHTFYDYSPGDDFYAMLIEAHRDLSDEQSALLNARLVLLLANHIGDLRILEEAITAAKADL
ncbi:MAG: DUF2783 domain-containing protein [Hydrogenophilus thermoluteolus]|uniref:DUF2783 domain-containing protein n=1 Tax=Hydrogenophilus thermoluteolus TaxID=297 RepID=UPI001C64048B|nr:DUF2783 domain-containing protein [Hydrogenophilus thermoluteolus]MBW7656412.1 DUF2783 domain-containing protein [Hydrogenophilus thermoluteolus]GLW60882.1 hypothetical protein Hthe01_12310 [Hydrogenophilus thermoluteolus]